MMQSKSRVFTVRGAVLLALVAGLAASLVAISEARTAQAAACVTPPMDYGTVTQSISVAEAGVYRVWTRIAAPDSSRNTYLLEVDGNDCYSVGGSSVPVYSNSSGPYFVGGTANWTSRTASGSFIDINLTAGNHQLKLIGAHADVVVDRILLTKDTVCVPTGVGNNCATEFFVADINEDGTIDYLDLSSMASRYNQSGAGIGRSDINRDGTVNYLDLSLLSNHYGG